MLVMNTSYLLGEKTEGWNEKEAKWYAVKICYNMEMVHNSI